MLRVMSTQKLPMVSTVWRAKPRISATSTAMPAAAEKKFCTARASHLRQIAHRGFAAIALPVGVGDEADRRVEGRIRTDRAESLRIQRQHALQALHGIHCQHTEQRKPQHRQRIAGPAHFLLAVHAAQAVKKIFDRSYPAHERWQLALVNSRHVPAEWLRQGDKHTEEQRDLQQSIGTHENNSGLSNAITR